MVSNIQDIGFLNHVDCKAWNVYMHLLMIYLLSLLKNTTSFNTMMALLDSSTFISGGGFLFVDVIVALILYI